MQEEEVRGPIELTDQKLEDQSGDEANEEGWTLKIILNNTCL